MNLIKRLGLEVAVDFFNSYMLFPLALFIVLSIYHSHDALRYKITYILLTIGLLGGFLLFEDKDKKKILS
jgi:formate hydrogenlyase subunit 3/multisubunit Na+/H+ antiporter MnhD subunit